MVFENMRHISVWFVPTLTRPQIEAKLAAEGAFIHRQLTFARNLFTVGVPTGREEVVAVTLKGDKDCLFVEIIPPDTVGRQRLLGVLQGL